MKVVKSILTIAFAFISLCSSGNNRRMLLMSDIDLKGKALTIPESTVLVGRGGVIKNGTVVGNNTTIESNKAIFSDVSIQGTWMLPEISTSLFANLNRVNSLKDVLALANPEVKNTIIIENGRYKVEALCEKDACLSVCSNTEMVLDGSITLMPNSFSMCDVIRLEGENIILRGKGQIVGDKFTHTGTEGEWGMGVKITNAKNIRVSDLTIKECWGDCIYINKQSKNVLIDGCYLDNGRRQGISVVCADGVTIRNCTITNVGGTNPQYAIDIEPNSKDYVDNVKIENVTIYKCKGGITTKGRIKDRKRIQIGSVYIADCDISSTKRIPVRLRTSKKVTVRNCKIRSPWDLNAVYVDEIDHIIVEGNTIEFDRNIIASTKRFIKSIKAGEEILPIKVSNSKTQNIKNNQVIR